MEHIPITRHNAKEWRLNEVDISTRLKCPDQNGVLTVCDYSKSSLKLAQVSMCMDTDGYGFTMTRDDGPVQAQYVRPGETYDPNGLMVFDEPVRDVSLRRTKESGLWFVEQDWDNVMDIEGLRVLVWAMAKYTLDKKDKLKRLAV